ncbi:MAG: glycoside hydrolase family 3 C-terminal domain-containing protein [Defluviitaleaceae bacterium]|nr:glycoside hydrolase family 3 C-terminal domain-containing protein [Defluviitaleaceae bacterium]
MNIEKTLSYMTLEEKASLCSGLGYWDTKAIDRLGIKSFVMTDGPNGVRLQQGQDDRFGLNESARATCFPTGSCLASSWDVELFHKVGAAIGREARSKNVSLVLGPAFNMKRSPLCGRNFEYLSEDPLLAGKLAAAYVNGMQSEGVGATPKHYAVNNQETLRQNIDVRIDERTLREIYLRAFEIVVKESAPWMLMSSYNKINGEFASQNKKILTDILRAEWGYKGLVVTDWYGSNERPKGVAAGQDLQMPGSDECLGDKEIVEAVKSGELDEKHVDTAVRNYLELYNKIQSVEKASPVDFAENHKIAIEAAAEGSVLLKNKDNILPISAKSRIAIIGEFAKKPRYQGGGSSHLNANHLDLPWDALTKRISLNNLTFSAGYSLEDEKPDEAMINEACEAAAKADAAVIFCGLTDDFESEGFDRTTMDMPKNHNALIEAVAAANPNTIVVLQNGSPVKMPWMDKVKGVLESYLGGEACGSAVAKILLGEINPSGKLAESFPIRLRDNPSHINFPGSRKYVEYREGIFIGYRYYASAGIETRAPFGFGLSYTTFKISDAKLSSASHAMGDSDIVVKCKVKNTGKLEGKEVVQVYVTAPHVSAIHPKIELKGFAKVKLAPNEEKEVSITLADLTFWNPDTDEWALEDGIYTIHIGNSSDNLPLSCELKVKGTIKRNSYDHNIMLGELLDHPSLGEWAKKTRKEFTIAMTGGIENTHTKLLLEKSTLELPMHILLNTGFLTTASLKKLLDELNGNA